MTEHKQAVVVGALGVIGRYIVARLLGQGDWSVVGLSRRTADAAPRYRHIASISSTPSAWRKGLPD